MKKYELIEREGNKLFRIKSLISFSDVRVGDIGGYVESEYNLSHKGDCWIYDNARICGNATIYDNARIGGDATICGNAMVYGDTRVISRITEPFKDIMSINCEKRLITIYKDLNNKIKCNIGCQQEMSLDDLIKRIEQDGGMKGELSYRKQYVEIMKIADKILI